MLETLSTATLIASPGQIACRGTHRNPGVFATKETAGATKETAGAMIL